MTTEPTVARRPSARQAQNEGFLRAVEARSVAFEERTAAYAEARRRRSSGEPSDLAVRALNCATLLEELMDVVAAVEAEEGFQASSVRHHLRVVEVELEATLGQLARAHNLVPIVDGVEVTVERVP